MAAGATYTPIATQTVGSSTGTVSFTSIPQTYTDLVLIAFYQGANDLCAQLNGDSGTNYSDTFLSGTGSSAVSLRNSNVNRMVFDQYAYPPTSSSFAVGITHFMNYSNSTTYKTVLTRTSSTYGTEAAVNLWRNTSAITSIVLFINGANINAGTTFTLYGIASA